MCAMDSDKLEFGSSSGQCFILRCFYFNLEILGIFYSLLFLLEAPQELGIIYNFIFYEVT